MECRGGDERGLPARAQFTKGMETNESAICDLAGPRPVGRDRGLPPHARGMRLRYRTDWSRRASASTGPRSDADSPRAGTGYAKTRRGGARSRAGRVAQVNIDR